MSTEAMKLALEALEYAGKDDFWRYQDKAITALQEALAEQPAQPQPEPLQNIPSLTTVLAYLERLVPSEVYTGMIDVIEDEFQRKQQPAEQQQEPVAIVDDSGVIVVCSYHYKPGDKLYTVPPARKPQQEPVPEAMKIVIEAMRADPDYAWSWHCNIAMAFVDAGGDHYTGNQGAARFMKMLANVTPAHELPSPPAQQEPVEYWTVANGWVSDQAEVPAAVWVEPDFWEHCNRVNCGTAYRLPAPGRQPLYTSPPAQRKPLTDEEIDWMTRGNNYPGTVPGARRFARAIEAKHGIKEQP